jgi:hypothetical protein
MKSILISFASCLLFVSFCHAEKLSLICTAFSYEVQVELNKPLKPGHVRYVGQTLAGFLNADDFALRVTTECKGKSENKVCLNLIDSSYCPKPSESFKFRELREDGSVVMISDRCDGSWTKYQLIGRLSSGDIPKLAYIEDKTYFQLKNQITGNIEISKDKPVLLLSPKEDGFYDLNLVSFRKELWRVNMTDSLRGKLKLSLEYYENDIHDSISLSSYCNKK